jgi:hypothetical protein
MQILRFAQDDSEGLEMTGLGGFFTPSDARTTLNVSESPLQAAQ